MKTQLSKFKKFILAALAALFVVAVCSPQADAQIKWPKIKKPKLPIIKGPKLNLKKLPSLIPSKQKALMAEAGKVVVQLKRQSSDIKSLANEIKRRDNRAVTARIRSMMKKNRTLRSVMQKALRDNLRTFTVFATADGAFVLGAGGGAGVALDLRQLMGSGKVNGAWIGGGGVSIGVQAGGGANLLLGFSRTAPSKMSGLGADVAVGAAVKAGATAIAAFDLPAKYTGFQVGVKGGAKFQISAGLSKSKVLGKF